MRLWMICYDIADDRRRRRVERLLAGHGERVQWSLFECLLGAGDLERLAARIAREIEPREDNLRYYPICAWCEERLSWYGQGRRQDDADLWLI